MTIPVVCAACGGLCRGHYYRCVDCGVIGGHSATCDGKVAAAMRIELDAILAEMTEEARHPEG